MRPTFMGFEMCKKGLQVNQKGLDITGNNIANIYTPGYTRQRVDQFAIAPATSMDRLAQIGAAKAGQGVYMNGVSQTRDATLDKRFRDEYADVGYYAEYSSILYDIETALGTVETETDSGIKNALASIMKSITDFSTNSNSDVHANIVATEFKSLTLVMQQLTNKLDALVIQEQATVNDQCTQINDILAELAGLNEAISEDYTNYATASEYFGPNELMDQRNYLLDQLSALIPINVKYESDGTATVTTEDGTREILSDNKHQSLYYQANDDGTVQVRWNVDAEPLSVSSGALKGTMDLLNGRGPYATGEFETYDKGLRYYQDKLDSFAGTFVQIFNNIVPEYDPETDAPKVDENGNIVYKQLLQGTNAKDMQLSDAFANDGTYLIYNPDSDSTHYANHLLDAIKTNEHVFDVNGQILRFTFDDFVNDYVTELGSEVAFYSGRFEASSTITTYTLDQRDSISAVSADEETSNMLLYSQSYNAISRVMTTMDEALDKLINSTGLVGR